MALNERRNRLQVRLDESRTRVNIDLAQHRAAGVLEAMRRIRRNNDDAARFHFALLVPEGDGCGTFDRERHFDIWMRMQRRALPRLSGDYVSGERRTVSFAYKLVGHTDKWQPIESCEAHALLYPQGTPENRTGFRI